MAINLSRAIVFSLMLGTQSETIEVEWKGTFLTPDDTYKWGAQKTGTAVECKKYADATMIIVAIPLTSTTADAAALKDATSKGEAAMQGTCTPTNSGDTIVPSDTVCYNLVFDQTSGDSTYTIDTKNAGAVAFFTQHGPTEFEDTEHYFKDTAGTDIEPVAQEPDPSAGGGHSHGAWADKYDGNCQCQAKKNGWKMDCGDKQTMEDAEAYLEANLACKSCSPTDDCKKKYLLVQAHHDHCLHDQLPKDMEHLMHDYEHYYDDCLIPRQYNPSLAECPAVDCKDTQAMTDAIAKLEADCAASCDACAADIKLVLMAHDTCPEEDLPEAIEKSLHDHEEVCESQLCNSAKGMIDVSKIPCSKEEEEHADHDHDHDHDKDKETKAPTAAAATPVPTAAGDTVVSAASGFGSQGFLMTMSAMWFGFSAM